jgi:perosamine synthetase
VGGPFDAHLRGRSSLLASGRSAIYWALKGLRLNPATTVWMPAFHCGLEVQAAVDAGLNVGFYRISRDMAVDERDLEHKLGASPGPVLVIHYFGFAQPGISRIASLCAEHGVVLIEDCAHALFSRFGETPLGTFAPMAVFSFRKTLPVLEGGMLLADEVRLGYSLDIVPGRFPLRAYLLYAKYAVRSIAGKGVTAAYRGWRFGSTDHADAAPVPPSLSPDRYNDRMAGLSLRLVSAADPAAVFAARCHNWQELDRRLSAIAGYRRLFACLSPGTCPLFLPIWTTNRSAIARMLMTKGIETFVFGAFPHPGLDTSAFPETQPMRDEILCLPVHQELGDRHMEQIVAAIAPALAGDAHHEVNSADRF